MPRQLPTGIYQTIDHRAATATTTETVATSRNSCNTSCTSTVTGPDQENKESI
ncbi:hypothetical protein FHX51_001230 [Aeriscardovia aeriphila]|uniref:Uncharacterized protein n=1 Tax=Aeriscardovia aeriphila TaxID=218139 RepID=A0A261FCJ9_9BIFI|nr:hypothetical protein [Aeriscardovia aeriphila]OZG56828.1 hypothetical protein AEAE_0137 [Aeriscardovia aeriphila]